MCGSCSQAGPSRRSLLLGGAALATIPLVGRVAQAQPVSAADTPDEALKLLNEGNERYGANQPRERDFSAGRASRALGQAPFAAILGCADPGSRPSWRLIKDQEICLLFALQAIS